MLAGTNPYDDLPYRSRSIEWTAPERLALTSLFHGGPRQRLDSYRVLELGCGDGANLLPMAYYRQNAMFVGIDGARSQIEIANSDKSELGLSNIDFIHSDFLTADQQLTGVFDFIIAHGVFSWVSAEVLEALFALCCKRLRPGGLLYLNYNTRPGWNVRGMVREFLLEQTAEITSLPARAKLAQELSAKLAVTLPEEEHPYSKLLANEFRFVCENDVSYVAHEFLSPNNQAYWRSEFMALAGQYGLTYVADADFNYSSGRVAEGVVSGLIGMQISGRTLDDTLDLLCYRQLHTAIFTHSPLTFHSPSHEEFAHLFVASCLTPSVRNNDGNLMFQHPSGYEVEAKEDGMRLALETLQTIWPRGLRLNALFPNVSHVMDDLKLLHRNGLIELRCVEPADFGIHPEPLNKLQSLRSESVTSPYHSREYFVSEFDSNNPFTSSYSPTRQLPGIDINSNGQLLGNSVSAEGNS